MLRPARAAGMTWARPANPLDLRGMRSQEPDEESRTITDPISPPLPTAEARLGVLWVAPVERFTPIAEGMALGREPSCRR
jgi:hypothetical protein